MFVAIAGEQMPVVDGDDCADDESAEPGPAGAVAEVTGGGPYERPDLAEVRVRYRAGFAHVDGEFADHEQIPLMRPRHGGSAHQWDLVIWLVSRNGYEDNLRRYGRRVRRRSPIHSWGTSHGMKCPPWS